MKDIRMAKKIKKTTPKSSYQKLSILGGTKAYAKLRQQVMAEGILKRDYTYYSILTICIILGFFISLYNIYTAPTVILMIVWSMIFAFFGVHIGGILHDAGHRAIFATTKMNDIFGHIVSAFIAFPFFDWTGTHNKHHAHPNQDEEDPDIELPFISLTKEAYRARTGFSKLIGRYQAYFWYPLGTFVGFSKRFYAYKYFKANLKRKIWWQLVLYGIGMFLWFILPFLLLPAWKAIIVVLVSNLTLGFYMANIFAPNHKGMPQLEHGVKLSFIEQQIITARNIDSNWLIDFVYMGLNYQIEHHLFPNCPRNKLKLLKPHVKNICKKLHLEYTVVDVLKSNKIILSELNTVARSQ